jgi:hypothetical protein
MNGAAFPGDLDADHGELEVDPDPEHRHPGQLERRVSSLGCRATPRLGTSSRSGTCERLEAVLPVFGPDRLLGSNRRESRSVCGTLSKSPGQRDSPGGRPRAWMGSGN